MYSIIIYSASMPQIPVLTNENHCHIQTNSKYLYNQILSPDSVSTVFTSVQQTAFVDSKGCRNRIKQGRRLNFHLVGKLIKNGHVKTLIEDSLRNHISSNYLTHCLLVS